MQYATSSLQQLKAIHEFILITMRMRVINKAILYNIVVKGVGAGDHKCQTIMHF